MSITGISAESSALSALSAFGTGMVATAHNIANVNTAAFDPVRVNYETGPQGYGVQAQVMPPSGPLYITPSSPSPQSFIDPAIPPEMRNPSGTDLAREFVTMINVQRAYEANAASIRTWDSMQGALLDMKV